MTRPLALVTGASSGIGAATARALAAAGHEVVCAARRTDRIADLAAEIDGRAVTCDVTDADSVAALAAEVGDRLDVLVNNAGISAIGAIDDHDLATHRKVLEVNHLGALACTLAALPALRASRGQIVTLGSVAAFAPVIGRPAYVAAKHAVTGLMEALRPELAADGVAVTMVHPTFVTAQLVTAEGSRERSTTGAQVTPEDVATAIVEAIVHRRDRALVGRTAYLAWHVNRLAPRTYAALMTRRLRRENPRGAR